MENRLIWITRGAKIYFNEIASIIESIKNNENSTKDTIAEETSFAKEGKVRSYLTVLRAYGLVEKEKRKYFKLTKIGKVISENDPFLKNEITRLATAYLKLLFPNLENIERKDFVEYCVKPAVALRQRVRTELHKLDKEYKDIQIEVEEDYI